MVMQNGLHIIRLQFVNCNCFLVAISCIIKPSTSVFPCTKNQDTQGGLHIWDKCVRIGFISRSTYKEQLPCTLVIYSSCSPDTWRHDYWAEKKPFLHHKKATSFLQKTAVTTLTNNFTDLPSKYWQKKILRETKSRNLKSHGSSKRF